MLSRDLAQNEWYLINICKFMIKKNIVFISGTALSLYYESS